MKTVIIGGVAGGATASARLRRNDEQADIVLVERGPYISFANCGLPYHLSGTIASRDQLLVATAELFRQRYRVDVRSGCEAVAIDRERQTVRLRDLASGAEHDESWDHLVLSPGAEPVRPPLPGIDSPRIFSLRNIPDLDRIMALLTQGTPRRAVVIGGGFIGVEVAENLHQRGLATSLVEAAPQVLAPLDEEMAAIVHAHLREQQVALYLSSPVAGFEDHGDHTRVRLGDGRVLPADLVVLAIGVRPETRLAAQAGLRLGDTGGIWVDEYLRTSDPRIFALGDAVEVRHTLSGRQALIALAGPANRQGRLVADHIAFGPQKPYAGTLGTSILKAFELTVASTGLNEKQLQSAGIPYRTSITHSGSHASYYPGATPICIKLLYSPEGRMWGAQAVGRDGVDKRIDVIATALQAGQRVHDLADLELAYAPPFGSAKDPVNIAGYVAGNVLNGSHRVIDWRGLRDIDRRTVQLVDVRSAAEVAQGSIPGARHIDLNSLREQLHTLDPQRHTVVFCQVGLRGYLAQRILSQHGFAEVKNLSGGYKTYAWAVGEQSHTAEAGEWREV